MTLRWYEKIALRCLFSKLGYVPKADLDEQKEINKTVHAHYSAHLAEIESRLALYETPHRHPVCVDCSKPVKRGQKYTVKFVKHEDCGGGE